MPAVQDRGSACRRTRSGREHKNRPTRAASQYCENGTSSSFPAKPEDITGPPESRRATRDRAGARPARTRNRAPSCAPLDRRRSTPAAGGEPASTARGRTGAEGPPDAPDRRSGGCPGWWRREDVPRASSAISPAGPPPRARPSFGAATEAAAPQPREGLPSPRESVLERARAYDRRPRLPKIGQNRRRHAGSHQVGGQARGTNAYWDAPAAAACAELDPVESAAVMGDRRRDVAQRDHSPVEPVPAEMHAEMQEEVLGTEHEGVGSRKRTGMALSKRARTSQATGRPGGSRLQWSSIGNPAGLRPVAAKDPVMVACPQLFLRSAGRTQTRSRHRGAETPPLSKSSSRISRSMSAIGRIARSG